MILEDFEKLLKEGRYSLDNITKKYLAPIINANSELRAKVREMSTIGVFVDDADKDYDKCLFFVCNVHRTMTNKGINFNNLLKQFKKEDDYVEDYPYGQIFGGILHVVVFRVPEKFHRAYNEVYNYLANKSTSVKYSTMFTDEQIKDLFVKYYGKDCNQFKVFSKDRKYKKEFEDHINSRGIYAQTTGNVDYIVLDDDAELEYLPNAEREILNYEKES